MLNLKNIYVKTKKGKNLLSDISITLRSGEILGITGASGSGKSTLLKVILGMLDDNCALISGTFKINDQYANTLKSNERRKLLGKTIGYIPQNPMTAFNPGIRIGKQIFETYRVNMGLSKIESRNLIEGKLKELKLSDTDRILNSFSTGLSGGMLQRVTIAILLGMSPEYIIADEPTSALDEENADILVNILRKQSQSTGIIFVSHDVRSLKALCTRMIILEQGKITEKSTVDRILTTPSSDWAKEFSSIKSPVKDRSYAL